MEVDIALLLALGGIALLAGFFDAIVGGGGLLTLPALFIAGLDPLAAMATNKFQASSASVSATVAFVRKGMVDWRKDAPLASLSFIAGGAGALSISLIPRELLQALVPVLLITVALYFALSPRLNDHQRQARISRTHFMWACVPAIGFYDGVFGPGTGSFFMIGFMMLLGQPLLRAVCSSKLLNASCNLGALSVFVFTGAVLWPLALVMATGAIAGAQLGARCALRFGAGLIRPLVVLVCCAMAAKLLWDPGNPLKAWLSSL